jgi:hypothetical protein
MADFTFPGAAPKPFRIVLIPDTQYYTEDAPSTYNAQTKWIIEQPDVVFAIHLGDITDDNTVTQWSFAKTAHATLKRKPMPYSVIPGNHDYPHDSDADVTWTGSRNTERYNLNFGPAELQFTGSAWKASFPTDKNDNNLSQFEAEGLRFMVIGLEMAPRKDAMCWADSVIRAHPDRRTIVTTHCYQNDDGSYQDCDQGYRFTGADGAVLWEELIERHSNIFAALSGHVNGAAHRVRTGLLGNPVHEILTDYQREERDDENNGQGWLRHMKFSPDQNLVQVRPYSVLGTTRFTEPNYSPPPGDSNHTFDFAYDMSGSIKAKHASGTMRFNDRNVNTESAGDQRAAAVAVDAAGAFGVVWEDDSQGPAVRLRAFRTNGCQRFVEGVVASGTTAPKNPDLAVLGKGQFVVVWDQGSSGSRDIRAQRFDAAGAPSGAPVIVSQGLGGSHFSPRVSARENGDFVVAWERLVKVGLPPEVDIRARVVRQNGTVQDLGSVSSSNSGRQGSPDVAMNQRGEFVVVWEDDRGGAAGVYQIRARWFDAAGTAPRADLTVNSQSGGDQRRPRVGIDGNGRYVVAWEDESNPLVEHYHVFARGLTGDGVEVFHDLRVNSEAEGQHRYPDIAVDTDGSFLVTWQQRGADPEYDVRIRGFNPNGTQRIRDVRASSQAAGQQLAPAIGLAQSGHFVVAWDDDLDRNGRFEILARGLHAGELAERHNRPAWPQ